MAMIGTKMLMNKEVGGERSMNGKILMIVVVGGGAMFLYYWFSNTWLGKFNPMRLFSRWTDTDSMKKRAQIVGKDCSKQHNFLSRTTCGFVGTQRSLFGI